MAEEDIKLVEVKPEVEVSSIEHLAHWWREPLAGGISVAIACFDVWWKGANAGFSNSLDEILLLTGIALIAGMKNLFGNPAAQIKAKEEKPKGD